MLFRFFPQEFKFFDLLEEQADYAVAAAVFFKEVVTKGEVTADDLRRCGISSIGETKPRMRS